MKSSVTKMLLFDHKMRKMCLYPRNSICKNLKYQVKNILHGEVLGFQPYTLVSMKQSLIWISC